MNHRNPQEPTQPEPNDGQDEPKPSREESFENRFQGLEPFPLTPPASFLRRGIEEREESDTTQQEILKEITDNLRGLNERVWTIQKTVDQFSSQPRSNEPLFQALIVVQNQLKGVMEEQAAIKAHLAQQDKSTDTLTAQSKTLEQASREIQKLSDRFFEERVIEPMARALITMFNLLTDSRQCLSRLTSVEGKKVLQFLEAIQTELCEFLAVYDIEPFRHKPGSRVDLRLMTSIKSVPAPTRFKQGLIRESCRPGLRWKERILKKEQVVVYQ